MCNIWEGGECKDVGNGDEINGKEGKAVLVDKVNFDFLCSIS